MSDITRNRLKSEWESKNPILRSGEFGFEEDTGKLKQGDGVKRWSQLSYINVAPYTLPKTESSFGPSMEDLRAAFVAPRVALAAPVLQAPRVSRVLTTFGPGHGWTGGDGASVVNLNDTTDAALGAQCVSWTTSGQGNVGGQRVMLRSPALTAFDATQHNIGVWVKLTNPTALARLKLAATDAAGVGYEYQFLGQGTAGAAEAEGDFPLLTATSNIYSFRELTSEWRMLLFDLSTAYTLNTPTTQKTAVTNIVLSAFDFGGGVKASGKFGGVALVPKSPTYPNGVITLGFDDGWASQYTDAKPAMDKYGFPGVAYVIQDLIGNARNSYMSLGDLHRLEDLSGWEVAGHSATVAQHNLTNAFGELSEAELRANLEKHKTWLLAEGFRGSNHLAYPRGRYTKDTARIVRDYFSTARTIAYGNFETAPIPADPLRMRTYAVDATYSLAQVQAVIDSVKSNRGWGQFYLHQVATGVTGTSTTPTIFTGIVDYIAAQGIPVRTVGDVLASR